MTDLEQLKRAVLKDLWSKGKLDYKFNKKYSYQKETYLHMKNSLENPDCSRYVVNIGRQWGKSSMVLIYALEYCIQHPKSIVRFISATQKQTDEIISVIFSTILEDCPENLKPHVQSQKGKFTFANSSMIHIAGGDKANADTIRGTRANLVILDEAGFIDDLDNLLGVVKASLMTTGGKVVLMSTPPTTVDHAYTTIAREAAELGFYVHKTIHDNPNIDPQWISNEIRDCGGIESTKWRREYLAEFCMEEELQIFPEWNEKYVQELKPDEYYAYYKKHVGMDMGTIDFTAILFGYYDFKRAIMYIEDEVTMPGHKFTTEQIANSIKEKEKELWNGLHVDVRIMDSNNLQMCNDMQYMHKLNFHTVEKAPGSKDAMVNEARIWIRQGRLLVHPRCKMLIGCLKFGIWDNKHQKFARSKKYKHYDHLDSLIYLMRNVNTSNPLPEFTPNNGDRKIVVRKDNKNSSEAIKIGKLFSQLPTGPKF